MAISYLEVLGDYYPSIEAEAVGDEYADITWISGGVISQAELDVAHLGNMKMEQIVSFGESATLDITKGFQSSALGTSYWYDSEMEDQLNLIGAVASNVSLVYATRDIQSGAKTYRIHTHAEMLQVLEDGKNVKLFTLQKFNTKKIEVMAVTDESQISTITWDS